MNQQYSLVAENLMLYLMLLVRSVARATRALLVLPFELSSGAARCHYGLSKAQEQLHGREFHLWVIGNHLGQTFSLALQCIQELLSLTRCSPLELLAAAMSWSSVQDDLVHFGWDV